MGMAKLANKNVSSLSGGHAIKCMTGDVLCVHQ